MLQVNTAQEDYVDDLRQKGNHKFQNENLDHVILIYTAALEKGDIDNMEQRVVNWCNQRVIINWKGSNKSNPMPRRHTTVKAAY
jgi:hypothetical protein